jgi:signal transduction histidine kinase
MKILKPSDGISYLFHRRSPEASRRRAIGAGAPVRKGTGSTRTEGRSQSDDLFLKAVALAIAVLCHRTAYVNFVNLFPSLGLPDEWFVEFRILLAISLATGIAIFFVKGQRSLFWLLILQNTLCFIIGLPEGAALSLKFSLVIVVLIETTLVLRFPRGPALSAVSIIAWLLVQRRYNAWFQEIPAPPLVRQIAFGSFALVIAATGSLVRLYFERYRGELAANQKLEKAILQLTSANMGFQEFATDVEERSTEEERRRVTRDIHDTVGYSLTNLNMMMEAAIVLAPGDNSRLRRLLEEAKAQALETLNATRFSLRSLRSIEPVQPRGLHRIQRLVKAFGEATRIAVSVEYGNLPWSFGSDLDDIVFRIIQEGMTNAFRHGHATKILIKMWLLDGDILQLVLRDNGRGADVIVEGIGITGMRERIAPMNGVLYQGNVVDGFEIVARIPLRGEACHG